MAKELGIHPCWFHHNHYDIPKKKINTIMEKAIVVRSRDISEIIKNWEQWVQTQDTSIQILVKRKSSD